MSNIVEFELESDQGDQKSILIDLDDSELRGGGEIEISAGMPGNVKGKAKEKFESAVEVMKVVAERLIKNVTESDIKPEEISVEFGIKFSATAGAFLAKAGSEAHLKVTMKW